MRVGHPGRRPYTTCPYKASTYAYTSSSSSCFCYTTVAACFESKLRQLLWVPGSPTRAVVQPVGQQAQQSLLWRCAQLDLAVLHTQGAGEGLSIVASKLVRLSVCHCKQVQGWAMAGGPVDCQRHTSRHELLHDDVDSSCGAERQGRSGGNGGSSSKGLKVGQGPIPCYSVASQAVRNSQLGT